MDKDTLLIFLGLVFGAAFLLTQSIVVPTFGTGRQESKRLKQRLGVLSDDRQPEHQISLVREKYFKKLSPFESWLESLPAMKRLETFIERSGHDFPAYRLVLLSLSLGLIGALVTWMLSHDWLFVPAGMLILGVLPFMKLKIDLGKRFAKFEEQLPEALDVITRALRAGYPFNETLQLVAAEMDEPIAKEFRIAFDEINFGVDTRWALHSMVERVPSMSLMAIVTTVLVQRETGGNLAETFENISKLIRGRFRFQRRVLTLTAEARMSAWVLAMVPFALFAGISIINPDYMATLTQDPAGQKVILWGLVLQVVGNFWIRKLIALEI
ncbi:type II secretion system F family protein [Candidatus Methylobacter oryzae]|uniref:Type II secretion system F family protein n=1 Tax=Candidatus Methylobacter oryzae TaxID=2497749 RepID=A0ABY3C5D3_9GAMM|nr:type II secretion system F family protein [Candidatus Methylobacter oryzae]TRW89687.1 type II secretion system F family protein [Candidatus Methylobacter oryzae]